MTRTNNKNGPSPSSAVTHVGNFDISIVCIHDEHDETNACSCALGHSARQIQQSLENLGGALKWTTGGPRAQLLAHLKEWSSTRTSSILYWIGHGTDDNVSHKLQLDDPADPYNTLDLATLVIERQADPETNHWTIVIIDACSSARAVKQIGDKLEGLIGCAVIGTNQNHATPGHFSHIITSIITRRVNNNNSDSYLARAFCNDILDEINHGGVWKEARAYFELYPKHVLMPARLEPGAPAAIDEHAKVVEYLESQPGGRHFASKAFGIPLSVPPKSPNPAVGALEAALGDSRLLAVTGSPGVGKSALLGQWLMARLSAAEASYDTYGIHLVGMSLRDAGEAMASVFQINPSGAGPTVSLPTILSRIPSGSVLILDAADEARQPHLITELMARRWEPTSPGPQVAIALRITDGKSLMSHLPGNSASHDVNSDPAVMADYVRRTTQQSLPVADFEGRDFLRVRLATAEVNANRAPKERVRKILDHGAQDLFREVLRRSSHEDADIVAALAFAKGQGYPHHVLAAAARSIDRSISNTDVDHALKWFGPYIVTDTADGEATFRLGHQTYLATILNNHQQGENGDIERKIALALLEYTVSTADTSDLSRYLSHELLDHIDDVQLWDHPLVPELLKKLSPDVVELAVARLAHADDRLPDAIRRAWGNVDSLREPVGSRREVLSRLADLRERRQDQEAPSEADHPSAEQAVLWARLSAVPLSIHIDSDSQPEEADNISTEVRFLGVFDDAFLAETTRGSTSELWDIRSLTCISRYDKPDNRLSTFGLWNHVPVEWTAERGALRRRSLVSDRSTDVVPNLDPTMEFIAGSHSETVAVGSLRDGGTVKWYRDSQLVGEAPWDQVDAVTNVLAVGPAHILCVTDWTALVDNGSGGTNEVADQRLWMIGEEEARLLVASDDQTALFVRQLDDSLAVTTAGSDTAAVIVRAPNGDSRIFAITPTGRRDLGFVPLPPLACWAAHLADDALYLANSVNGRVAVYRITEGTIRLIAVLPRNADSLAVISRGSGSATVVTACRPHGVELWHPTTEWVEEPRQARAIDAHRIQDEIVCAMLTVDFVDVVAGSSGAGLPRYRVDGLTAVAVLAGRAGYRLAIGNDLGAVSFVGPSGHARVGVESHRGLVSHMRVAPDQRQTRRLASVSGKEVFLWNPMTASVTNRFELNSNVLDVGYVRSDLFALCEDRTVWKLALDGPASVGVVPDGLTMFAVSPMHSDLVLAGPGGITCLDTATGEGSQLTRDPVSSIATLTIRAPARSTQTAAPVAHLIAYTRPHRTDLDREVYLLDAAVGGASQTRIPSVPLGASTPTCLASAGATLFVGCDDGAVAFDVDRWLTVSPSPLWHAGEQLLRVRRSGRA